MEGLLMGLKLSEKERSKVKEQSGRREVMGSKHHTQWESCLRARQDMWRGWRKL